MKKLFLVSLLAAIAVQAQAEPVRLINGDGSELTGLCIAAAESGAESVNLFDRRDTLCNGMPLQRFAQKIRRLQQDEQTAYVFVTDDDSKLSRLCLAAVESDEAFRSVRRELFDNAAGLEESVLCNDMPLKEFTRKYRGRNKRGPAMTAGL